MIRLGRPERAPERETIVPLIDVVFFLLVFFLLVGRYDATAPFEVMPPVADMGAPLPAGGRTVSLAADGRLALDGVEMDRDAAVARLAEAAEAGPLLVRINADGSARLGALLPLVEALNGAGVADAVLVVTPPDGP